MNNSINNYDFVFYAGREIKTSDFLKQFPECTIRKVTPLKTEIVEDGTDKYNHPLRGCAHTSMGDIEVYNYSDKS